MVKLEEPSAAIPFGIGTGSMARLQAIHKSLETMDASKYLLHRHRLPLSLFKDCQCQYARTALLSASPQRKNFLLIKDLRL